MCTVFSGGTAGTGSWPEQILCQPIADNQSSYSSKPNMHSRPIGNLIKKEMKWRNSLFCYFALYEATAFGPAAHKEKFGILETVSKNKFFTISMEINKCLVS